MRVFLFDLDGTLIDSADDIALSLKLTLEEIGGSHRMPTDVRALVGGGIRALLEKVLGEEFREEYVEIFRRHYTENPVVRTRPYAGVPETLRELRQRGKRLVVVTNKLEDLSREILRRLSLLDLFDLVVGGDTFPEKKPSPVPLLESLRMLGESPADAVMVGDTHTDISAGRSAGTRTALARWGYVKVGELEPDFVLHSPEDLLSLA